MQFDKRAQDGSGSVSESALDISLSSHRHSTIMGSTYTPAEAENGANQSLGHMSIPVDLYAAAGSATSQDHKE